MESYDVLATTLGFSLALSLMTIAGLFNEAAKEAGKREPVGVVVYMACTLCVAALVVFQVLCIRETIQ
jgi:hypothetical protein